MNMIEYAIEALCLGIFMVMATLATTLLELPSSPIHQALAQLPARFTDPLFRRFLLAWQ